MTRELVGVVNATAGVGASFLVQSMLLIGAALLLGRYVVKNPAVRCALYQATLAAIRPGLGVLNPLMPRANSSSRNMEFVSR